MMSTNAILRAAVLSLAALCLSLASVSVAFGQDPGPDFGGGAGIFRPKNPETKRATKPNTGTKPTNRTTGPARPRPSAVAERVEDLLDKGKQARGGRKLMEDETEIQDA